MSLNDFTLDREDCVTIINRLEKTCKLTKIFLCVSFWRKREKLCEIFLCFFKENLMKEMFLIKLLYIWLQMVSWNWMNEQLHTRYYERILKNIYSLDFSALISEAHVFHPAEKTYKNICCETTASVKFDFLSVFFDRAIREVDCWLRSLSDFLGKKERKEKN